MPVDYMIRLKLDDAEIASRRAFYEITDEDLVRLANLRPTAEKHTDAVVEDFYRLILSHPGSRAFFPDEATLIRVKRHQREYFLGLFSGQCDRAYVENRLRVGMAHERVGIEPKWYIGAYARYMRILLSHFANDLGVDQLPDVAASLIKLIMFDMALALDTYIAAQLDTVAKHQAAVRELSTPVIRVFSRVLLLPLIGSVDEQRARQIMETLLSRVVEEQAKSVIIDIAGVPVVDTAVADHLLKTTEAVRLLGTETIITGISAQVARTIVNLGVDIGSIHTRTRLADGIELALTLVGKEIGPAQIHTNKDTP